MMRLFDTNAHPDEAVRSGAVRSYGAFAEAARAEGWLGACAVALPATDPVAHARACADDPDFYYPVAPWKSCPAAEVGPRFDELLALGYRAIKIHPRFGGPAFGSEEFAKLAEMAAASATILFVCTYPFGAAALRRGDRILEDLESSLADNAGLRLVLLHGGGPDLLRYSEFARANREEILLDLSLTVMKYPGSSIDLDIAFLVAMFDERISFGSDYPWYSPREVGSRIASFMDSISEAKAENCLFRSATSFLGLSLD